MKARYYVYIMTNKKNNTVLYTGITGDLKKRIWEHKNSFVSSFTSRYNINKLAYFEEYTDVLSAIEREKQIKGGSRKKED